MFRRSNYWFPAKRYGYGWGLPSRWQGWLVLAVYLVLLLLSQWLVPVQQSPLGWFACVVSLTAGLLAICWFKGEPRCKR